MMMMAAITFAALSIFLFLIVGNEAAIAQASDQVAGLTNVKSALFRNGYWDININYLAANSSDFWRTYVLKTNCETEVNFQEVFCLGKSIRVAISDMRNTSNVYNLLIKSNQNFNCSVNIQDPNAAILDPLYAKAQVRLPKGDYEIAMKLDNYTNVLGFRGYAIQAKIPIDRLIAASKCRDPHNPNM